METKKTHIHHKKTSHGTTIKKTSSYKKREAQNIDKFADAKLKEEGLTKLVSARKFMESGGHLGLPLRLWNPKMQDYVYPDQINKSNPVKHKNKLFDIQMSLAFLDRAYKFIKDSVQEGATVLFVGTRGKIIREHVKKEAKRVGALYVNQRWLGGTLTNWKTISKSIEKFNKLMSLQMSEDIKKYTKKEQIMFGKQINKMEKFLGGIRLMRSNPQIIVVSDPVIEHNAILEAKKMGIQIVAICNTNADPEGIDFIIPANTNSIKTTYLLISILCDAIAEANDKPLSVVGKSDDEIFLPEIQIKSKSSHLNIISHKKFNRHRYNKTQ